MDQEMSDNKGICKNLGQVDQGNNEKSSNSVNGVVLETVVVINSGETASVSEGNGNLGSKVNELGSNKVLGEASNKVDQESGENSNNSVDGVGHETVIVISSDEVVSVSGENRESVAKGGGDGGVGGGFKENGDGERVCRICHLGSEGSLETTTTAAADTDTTVVTMDLIQLGCGCKDELGISHIHCAEAWFKLRGNRLCEICGQSAKNITGVDDNRFMEEWNEWRFIGSSSSSSERGRCCWPVQPFGNFLMAGLVIAFVLLWFFHVNMSL